VSYRRILAAAIGVVLLGCSGLLGPDPTRIVALEQALTEADPASAADILIAGSVDAGSVRFGCATAFGALAEGDPSQREARIAEALGDWTVFCPTPCADDLPALLEREPSKRIGATLAQCDAAGPDAVFGGPLAGLRPSMPPMEYLAVRRLTELADEASPTFASLHPKLAVSLVLKDRPTDLVPGTDLTVQANRAIEPESLVDLQSAIRDCGPETVVSHRVVLDPGGRVAGVAGGAPQDPGAPCVVAALEALVLPPDGEYAVLDLAWKPEPVAHGGRGSGSRQPVIDGPIGQDVVEDVIRAHVGQTRYCYEKQLARSPSLTGDVVIRFAITPSGRVSHAETIASTFGSPAFARCLEAAFEKWEFPRVPAAVTVTWPIHFAPG
jgi:TonB family protein